MAVFDPMALATVKLSKQWSIEGGSLTKPFGLDVKESRSTGELMEFVKIDKNADWLLKTLFGKVNKGCLRKSGIFVPSKRYYKKTRRGAPNTPKGARPPPQSRTRPLP